MLFPSTYLIELEQQVTVVAISHAKHIRIGTRFKGLVDDRVIKLCSLLREELAESASFFFPRTFCSHVGTLIWRA